MHYRKLILDIILVSTLAGFIVGALLSTQSECDIMISLSVFVVSISENVRRNANRRIDSGSS